LRVAFDASVLLSLLPQDRKHVADVDGANAPQLEQLVKQHLPPLGNDDEET
jgi:hypothetical protein